MLRYIPDDTYITLRYARNLVRGDGLVFNRGERVEGYTNFLWLVVVATAGKLGFPFVVSARFLSLLFSAGILIMSGLCGLQMAGNGMQRGWPRALAATGAPLLLAASSPFATWSGAGTEMPFFTFILLTGFYFLLRRSRREAVLTVFAIAALVRPEGIAYYIAAAAVLAVYEPGLKKTILMAVGIPVLLYVPYLAWKWSYFHSLLPNTFYAKTGPALKIIRNGASYLAYFAAWYGYLLPAGLVLAGRRILAEGKVVGGRKTILLFLFIIVNWSETVIKGGDWMINFRMLLPSLPLLMIFVSSGIVSLIEEKTAHGWRKRAAVPTIMLIAFLAALPGAVRYDNLKMERIAVGAFARLGMKLKEILPPGTSLGCGSTGAIGYYSDLPIVDILGLTEPEIARRGKIVSSQPGHMKTLGSHVLSREPDLLLLGNIQIHQGRRDEDLSRIKVQELDIILLDRFTIDYQFINLPLGRNFYLSCYKRRGFFLPL